MLQSMLTLKKHALKKVQTHTYKNGFVFLQLIELMTGWCKCTYLKCLSSFKILSLKRISRLQEQQQVYKQMNASASEFK